MQEFYCSCSGIKAGSFEEADILIEPPPTKENTDENSGDDEEGFTISNLNRHQL